MTLTSSYQDVTRMALLVLAMLASIMALALVLGQPAGMPNVSLSIGAETSVVFHLQADGYTWLPNLSNGAETVAAFHVQADGYTYLPTI